MVWSRGVVCKLCVKLSMIVFVLARLGLSGEARKTDDLIDIPLRGGKLMCTKTNDRFMCGGDAVLRQITRTISEWAGSLISWNNLFRGACCLFRKNISYIGFLTTFGYAYFVAVCPHVVS